MKYVAGVLSCAKVFDNIIKVAEVFIGWLAALCPGKGNGGHDVGAAFGKV